MVFVTMFFTLRSKETSTSTKIASIIASALVVGQIILGAFVIVEKLHAVLVTMHLGMGLILFIMILTVYLDVKEISKKISSNRLRMINPSE
jgi:cytochrome c oxidase assembly protein subunit 15